MQSGLTKGEIRQLRKEKKRLGAAAGAIQIASAYG
jgi:hypothetical protein